MKKPYRPGEVKAQCDICGLVGRRSEMKMQWDQLLAHADTCWSPKHQNERPIPVINDGLPVANARPAPLAVDRPQEPVVSGFTSWSDTTLIWEDPTWLWSDDPADGNKFGNANLS